MNDNNSTTYQSQYANAFEKLNTLAYAKTINKFNKFDMFNALAYAKTMNKLRENLQSEMDNRGWNPYKLSEVSGVPQSTIQRFLSGKHQELRDHNVRKLAYGLNITEFKLRGLDGNEKYKKIIDKNDKEKQIQESNAETSFQLGQFRHIPIVGNAQLGDDGFWCALDYPQGFGDGYIYFPVKDFQAYALRCIGDSMKPRIRNGEFVIVEPNREPISGDEVLIKSIDGRVMVKTLLYRRNGRVYLHSINEAHPSISFALDEISVIHPIAAIVNNLLWNK